MRGLALATHLGPTLLVTALATGVVVAWSAPAATVALVSGAVLTGQASVGWSNDWLDAQRDLAVGRTDKPVVAGTVTVPQLRRAAMVAAALCIVFSLAVGAAAGAVHLAAVAMGWAYNAGGKSTWFSWLPYAAGFGLLAVFLALAAGAAPVPVPLVVGAALLGLGAHFANVVADLEQDAATGVHGLVHRLGRRRAVVIAPVSLAGAVVVLWPGSGRGVLGWVVAVVALALAMAAGVSGWRHPRTDWSFRLSMAVAAMCAVLLVSQG